MCVCVCLREREREREEENVSEETGWRGERVRAREWKCVCERVYVFFERERVSANT